jgi:hypothetical protein
MGNQGAAEADNPVPISKTSSTDQVKVHLKPDVPFNAPAPDATKAAAAAPKARGIKSKATSELYTDKCAVVRDSYASLGCKVGNAPA